MLFLWRAGFNLLSVLRPSFNIPSFDMLWHLACIKNVIRTDFVTVAYLPTLPVFPGVYKFFMKSPGLQVRAPNLPGTTYRGSFYISFSLISHVMCCYCIEKSEIQKKGPLIKMAPTLQFFGLSPGFCTLGVGRHDHFMTRFLQSCRSYAVLVEVNSA